MIYVSWDGKSHHIPITQEMLDVIPINPHSCWSIPHVQWIGLRDNLQESPISNGKSMVSWRFSRPIHWRIYVTWKVWLMENGPNERPNGSLPVPLETRSVPAKVIQEISKISVGRNPISSLVNPKLAGKQTFYDILVQNYCWWISMKRTSTG